MIVTAIVALLAQQPLWADDLQITNAPAWATRIRINTTVRRVERFLEWDLRRISLIWYSDTKSFETAHRMGPNIRAVTQKQYNRILVGPLTTPQNFDQVLAHELTHMILFQKFKDAIPSWLEEGLANHIGKIDPPDYRWLNTQAKLPRVQEMKHPFLSGNPKLMYQISGALIGLISSKCDLQDVLQLAVGKKLETYLHTTCALGDLDQELKTFVSRKSRV